VWGAGFTVIRAFDLANTNSLNPAGACADSSKIDKIVVATLPGNLLWAQRYYNF
jgi:hypothetical protein